MPQQQQQSHTTTTTTTSEKQSRVLWTFSVSFFACPKVFLSLFCFFWRLQFLIHKKRMPVSVSTRICIHFSHFANTRWSLVDLWDSFVRIQPREREREGAQLRRLEDGVGRFFLFIDTSNWRSQLVANVSVWMSVCLSWLWLRMNYVEHTIFLF